MKCEKHLTIDQLIDRVYELNGSDHIRECPECAARLEAMETLRRETTPAQPVSDEFLASQRRLIYSRIEHPPARRLRWLPALAAAGALATVALVYRPPAPPAVHPEPTDAQLFSEVYSMEQSTEPAAGAPIHELFEDNNQ